MFYSCLLVSTGITTVNKESFKKLLELWSATKIYSICPWAMSHPSKKSYQNPFITFRDILHTHTHRSLQKDDLVPLAVVRNDVGVTPKCQVKVYQQCCQLI